MFNSMSTTQCLIVIAVIFVIVLIVTEINRYDS